MTRPLWQWGMLVVAALSALFALDSWADARAARAEADIYRAERAEARAHTVRDSTEAARIQRRDSIALAAQRDSTARARQAREIVEVQLRRTSERLEAHLRPLLPTDALPVLDSLTAAHREELASRDSTIAGLDRLLDATEAAMERAVRSERAVSAGLREELRLASLEADVLRRAGGMGWGTKLRVLGCAAGGAGGGAAIDSRPVRGAIIGAAVTTTVCLLTGG